MNLLDASKSSDFGHVLGRLQKCTLPSHLVSSQNLPCSVFNPYSGFSKSLCTLDAPFAMSYPRSPSKEPDVSDGPAIIDTFAPRLLSFDLSPTSSASSEFDSISSHTSFPPSSFDAFVATRSRVVRVCGARNTQASPLIFIPVDQFYNLLASADVILSAGFSLQSVRLSYFSAIHNRYPYIVSAFAQSGSCARGNVGVAGRVRWTSMRQHLGCI
jgi:hypothetical protein